MLGYDTDSNQLVCSHMTLQIIITAKHLFGYLVSAQYQCTVCQHKSKKAHDDQPNGWQHVRCSTTANKVVVLDGEQCLFLGHTNIPKKPPQSSRYQKANMRQVQYLGPQISGTTT